MPMLNGAMMHLPSSSSSIQLAQSEEMSKSAERRAAADDVVVDRLSRGRVALSRDARREPSSRMMTRIVVVANAKRSNRRGDARGASPRRDAALGEVNPRV